MQSVAGDVLAAEIAIATRSPDLTTEASELLRKLYEQDVLFTPGWVALLPRLLGACEVLRGNLESGERLLRHALEVALRCGAKAELASTHLEFAELFARRSDSGDMTSAASHVVEARRLSVEISTSMMSRRLEQLQHRVRA